jgi:membrane fusion protein (multidrug efflux system)
MLMITALSARAASVVAPSLAFVVVVLLLAGCGEEAAQEASQGQPAAPPPSVGVVAVAVQDVTPATPFNGRVEAIDKVDLRARITGFLEQRHFTEGQEVKQGDLLFTIEKQQYEAEVQVAEAAVAQAQAVLTDAQLQLDRGQELLRNRNIPTGEVDARRARRDRAQADLLGAQAQLREARINLGYTEVTAPVTGKIGRSAFTVGAFVGPDSGALATIVSQDPIYVTFPVSSRRLLDARKEAEARGEDLSTVRVKVRLPDGTLYDHTGSINFVGNQVDPSTDTVTIRAELPNPRRVLVDEQLVGIVVESAQPQQALVVPQAAVLTDQAGSYVLVVDGENKVEQRRVQLGEQTGRDVTIQTGLKQGERVVVDGLQKVRPGQAVQATQATAGAA